MRKNLKIIAHRGNLEGPSSSENAPHYLQRALDLGFDIEADVWMLENGELWLGHDKPQYRLFEDDGWFLESKKVWVHCKNIGALQYFKDSAHRCHYFYIDIDDFVLTDKGVIWGTNLKCNVLVDANAKTYDPERHGDCEGICTDYAGEFA